MSDSHKKEDIRDHFMPDNFMVLDAEDYKAFVTLLETVPTVGTLPPQEPVNEEA